MGVGLDSGSSAFVGIKCSVKCPKCGQGLVPVYLGEFDEFLIGGWCAKCKKHYPLVPTDLDTAFELYPDSECLFC